MLVPVMFFKKTYAHLLSPNLTALPCKRFYHSVLHAYSMLTPPSEWNSYRPSFSPRFHSCQFALDSRHVFLDWWTTFPWTGMFLLHWYNSQANVIYQIYNSTVTQMSACLLSLAVMSLLLPVRSLHRCPFSANSTFRLLSMHPSAARFKTKLQNLYWKLAVVPVL
jgi:hypothetical protein